MTSLIFWGGGRVLPTREGSLVVAWSDGAAAVLREAGIPHRTLGLTPDEADRVDEAAIGWCKAWGKRPVEAGRSVRELLSWKGVSLWWFAELYLHYSTRAPHYVRVIEAFRHVLAHERPDEVEAAGLPADEAILLGRTCTSLGILFHGQPEARGQRWRVLKLSLASRWNTFKTLAAALKASLPGHPPARTRSARRVVLFLSHAAFWRERRDPETSELREYEHYFDRLIPEVAADAGLEPVVVAVGPRAAFRRRRTADRFGDWLRLHAADGPYLPINRHTSLRVFRETLRATGEVRRAWRRLRSCPGIHEAFSHQGVSFADLAAPDLAGTLLLQLPWAVRSYEEMIEALREHAPAVVCLYAESSGWGRAALAACRAEGVPTVAIQHGILYPKYYSYIHAADEADCPRPDQTALFGEAARRILAERGQYPAGSLVLTGSPKFDDLLKAAGSWDRAALRRRLGIGEGEQLVVVASRFRGIRQTHQSIASAFGALVRAVEAADGVRALVKPHPAERAQDYQPAIREAGSLKVRVLAPGADLMELLHAADALVTVESLSAVEALVLGRPVLILNMPTNLREIVEAGAALGVAQGEDPAPALRALLFDPKTRERLDRDRAAYLFHVAQGVDGRATERILALLRATAMRPA